MKICGFLPSFPVNVCVPPRRISKGCFFFFFIVVDFVIFWRKLTSIFKLCRLSAPENSSS